MNFEIDDKSSEYTFGLKFSKSVIADIFK